MKKNNSKKWIKTITITTAVLVFATGAVFALKSAGTANTDKDSADTVVAAANEATDLVVKETVSEKETEVITETATDRGCNRSSSGTRSYRGCYRVTCCTDSIRCKSCTGYSRN